MPRIVMLVELPDGDTEKFFDSFESMVEDGEVDGFFSLSHDGKSFSSELPDYMEHEKKLSDCIAELESKFLNG